MIDSKMRLCGMLGLAMRAGKVTIGTEQVCLAMSRKGRGKPSLVLVSVGASEATKKKVTVKAEFYGIETVEIDIGIEELGKLLGKTYAPATVAIVDTGFADAIRKVMTN